MEKAINTQSAAKGQRQARSIKVKFPIGGKLLIIITMLLIISLSAITMLVSVMVSNDVRITAEDNNFSINKRSASAAEAMLGGIRANTLVMLETLDATGLYSEAARNVPLFFFNHHPEIAAIVLIKNPTSASATPFASASDNTFSLVNNVFFTNHETDSSLAGIFFKSNDQAITRAAYGEELLVNANPVFGFPLLALFLPFTSGRSAGVAGVLFSPEGLDDSFGTGANTSYMINEQGDVLVHPDADLARSGVNFGDRSFVRRILESPTDREQTAFKDNMGKEYIGAFDKLDIANAVVITEIASDIVFEGIKATTKRNIFLSISVLFLAMLFIWFFSGSISIPLKRLTLEAKTIEDGDFAVRPLHIKTKDEIGTLAQTFEKMRQALLSFSHFTNMEIARMALNGALRLGGEQKKATVFFSDIRSFTAISEKLTPAEVVEFLNDYMTRMVACVQKTGGIVDKYIGDSVMAHWGAATSSGNTAHDALNCVRSALMMRVALLEFNKDRGTKKKPIIKIGCGINTGDVVAGQIGSNERMEYTVIGDAVNLASRTEALNKPLGTDILITEQTWRHIKQYLITHEMPSVTVKGKSRPVRLFAVINLRARNGEKQPFPTTLKEVRKLLNIEAPDLSKVNVDEEEKKYNISG
jgi:adenylate cyclase